MDYIALHDKVLERIDTVVQDYIDSNLANFKQHLQETSEFIDDLPLTERQKELLNLSIEYHRLLVEDCLQRLEDMNRQSSKALRQRFLMLTPEQQREAISAYKESPLFVIKGGNRQ